MSSGNILPTLSPAPPDVRRAPISRDIERRLSLVARPSSPREENTVHTANPRQTSQPIPAINLAGPLAVTLQVAESVAPSAFVPVVLPAVTRSTPVQIPDSTRGIDDERALGLTEEEEAFVRELQAIDREVRAHEAAHANVGGAFAGQPAYEFVAGPDGIRYAVSGRVQIDVDDIEGDPEATIRKLETVRRAALAPAQPSGQDRAVAAQAAAGIREARAELSENARSEQNNVTDQGAPGLQDEAAAAVTAQETFIIRPLIDLFA